MWYEVDKVTISVVQISRDYKLMKHNDEDENLSDVGDEEVAVGKGYAQHQDKRAQSVKLVAVVQNRCAWRDNRVISSGL